MDEHFLGFALGVPFPPIILEFTANFLLFRVYLDHRLPLFLKRDHLWWVYGARLAASKRQHKFDQIVDLLRAQVVENAVSEAVLSLNDQLFDGRVAAVVEIGSRSPNFHKDGGGKLVRWLIQRADAADVVQQLVGIGGLGMTLCAADFWIEKYRIPAIGCGAQPTIDQVRTRNWSKRFEIRVDGCGLFLGPNSELDVRKPRPHC